jgi:Protein of unknown function (DUF2924)
MTPLPELAAMDRAGLARLWADLIGGAVPASMSQPMQRRFLAFDLQARAEGGLSASLRTRLDRIAAGLERKAAPRLQPGARLLRAWNGTTHVVDALPEGFLWNGTRHRSLSAIARAITGARWSGPRFFGLVSAGTDPAGLSGTGTAQVRKTDGRKAERPLPPTPARGRAA